MRNTNQSAFCHARHLIDVTLNLCGVNVVAAADDQVFAAPDDDHVAPLIDLTDIARFEISVSREFLFGFLGHTPVAAKHIGAFDLDATNFAHWQGMTFVVMHAQGHTGQWETHRAATALGLARVARIGGIGV